MPPPRPQSSSLPYGAPEQLHHPAPVRGRALVINSSFHLLQAFLFFHHRQPAVLICWTMGQQAFNACMILILDAWETANEQNIWLVNQAFVVFTGLERNGVHKLAELAVSRISDGLVQLGNRREERKRQAAASRRSSQASQPHEQRPPTLTLDTTSMMDWSSDAVMGNTGMFLLEDTGLQSYVQQPFRPLGWNMAGSAHPSGLSDSPTPTVPQTVPVSQVTAAPFPVMSSTYMGSASNSPYVIGMQQRMPNLPRRSTVPQQAPTFSPQQNYMQQAAFTPINSTTTSMSAHPQHIQQFQRQQQQSQQQQSFSQLRGPRASPHTHHSSGQSSSKRNSVRTGGGGPRGVHKFDKPPRSQQRRK